AVFDTTLWVARALHPSPVRGVDPVAADRLGAGLDQPTVPLMDRWDQALLAAANGDRELYARTKAVMWVESGGRQYAVSSTGCLGLMQFCASTARTKPVHAIFGRGQVTACGCRDCGVPRDVANDLETDPAAVARVGERFPCPLTDARFDPDKAIRAGTAWVEKLGRDVGDNLLLVYVSYNSGPAVGRAVFRATGKRSDVTLDELRPHLVDALAPHYGRSAAGRAQGLLDVHLPKLQRAYERWRW
ncbi:MAG: transglycosylase SLT domain-containing protein, partial [Myxococcales bacterium]|nr:transglycosylase SLT domain-containing protein [Myxococcales bacterium]